MQRHLANLRFYGHLCNNFALSFDALNAHCYDMQQQRQKIGVFMFQQMDKRFKLEVANFGSGNNRVVVFRLIGANMDSEWEQITGTRALLIGGEKARAELRRLIDSSAEGLGRPALQSVIPGGFNGRSHNAMRKFVGL